MYLKIGTLGLVTKVLATYFAFFILSLCVCFSFVSLFFFLAFLLCFSFFLTFVWSFILFFLSFSLSRFLYLFLSFFLSFFLSYFLSFSLSFFLSITLSFFLSFFLSFSLFLFLLSCFLSLFLTSFLSFSLSFFLSAPFFPPSFFPSFLVEETCSYSYSNLTVWALRAFIRGNSARGSNIPIMNQGAEFAACTCTAASYQLKLICLPRGEEMWKVKSSCAWNCRRRNMWGQTVGGETFSCVSSNCVTD